MSNPDKDFPNDPDSFTPLQDVPNLQDPEVMPDPVTDQHLKTWAQQEEERLLSWSRLPQEQKVRFLERWWREVQEESVPFGLEQEAFTFGNLWVGPTGPAVQWTWTWSQQVEQESVAGPVEPLSSPPWPPLSREQVVELHEALVGFRRTMESSKTIRDPDEQMSAIWDVATGLDGILVRLNIGTPQPTAPKPEVKRNCWTCQLWRSANRNGTDQPVCFSGKGAVVGWIEVHIPRGSTSPSHNADGCPGWTPKS